MRTLIGIDDTDNIESRGTGFRARSLAGELAEAGLATARGVSRHQLFVHDDIPYTSHNSSLCLDLDVTPVRHAAVAAACRAFLLRESADGSDAGLCIAGFEEVSDAVRRFGLAAKTTVLTKSEARSLAASAGVLLEGLTGDQGGVIGALAAVGLRHGGADGRFVWLDRVRDLSGTVTAAQLLHDTGIDSVCRVGGRELPGDATICIDPWPRPVLQGGRAVLLVRPMEDPHAEADWELLARDEIRAY